MSRILASVAALLLLGVAPGTAAATRNASPDTGRAHAHLHAALPHGPATRTAEAERLARELVRTARHLRYRLERRVDFGGRAEARALRAAAALEREARRLRGALAATAVPIGAGPGRRLTGATRVAFDVTAERLGRIRAGRYLTRELREAHTLLRRLERELGRPDRPHWHAAAPARADRHASAERRPAGRAPGNAH